VSSQPSNSNRVEIGLYPVQNDFIHSKAHFRGFVGGRGAGKSFVGSYDLLRRSKPRRLYLVVAPTYKVLKDASFRSFIDHARHLRFIKKVNQADLRVTLGNDAEVLFRSAENPDSLRGPNISGCWMDEASYCSEEAYNVVIACLREAGEQGWLGATFTPKGKGHWTFKILGKNIIARQKNQDAIARGEPPVERLDPNVALFTARTKDNPFLPPEFESVLRSQYTSTMAAQELEGSFLDVGGKLFNRAWFSQIMRVPPAQARWVRYWDKAATQDGGCHTCGVLMGADYEGRFWVADIIRGQWSTHQREAMMKLTAQMDAQTYHHRVRIFVEQEPGSGGVDSLKATIKNLAGFPVFGDRPSRDKRVRAEPFAAQAEAGNVILVEPPGSRNWLAAFLDELEAFPDGEADQVDATSGAFNRLIEGNAAVPVTATGGAAGKLTEGANAAALTAARAGGGIHNTPGVPPGAGSHNPFSMGGGNPFSMGGGNPFTGGGRHQGQPGGGRAGV
jgi:predicted phage terminase large subunit-like protein